jgi:hypothetical protein
LLVLALSSHAEVLLYQQTVRGSTNRSFIID